MLHRTQVQLTDEQFQALKARALREGVSLSALVRRAVNALVRSDSAMPDSERRSRAVDAAGRFGSGRRDTSRCHDDVLAETFR